jgi:MFS transporter, DHA1 family, multidrug resistance protein
LGGIAALLVPIPVLFYLYGHKIRAKSSFAPTFGPNMPGGAKKAEDSDSGKDMSEKPKDDDMNNPAFASIPKTTGSKEQV